MNSKVISLIINVGVAIIAGIGIYLVILAMGNTATIDPETGQESADTTSVVRAVSYAMYTLYIAAGVIALFTLVGMVVNPKRFIRTGISILVFGLLILVAYFMVNHESPASYANLTGVTEENLFWGDLGIRATYVLVAVAIGLILVQLVRNLLGYFSK